MRRRSRSRSSQTFTSFDEYWEIQTIPFHRAGKAVQALDETPARTAARPFARDAGRAGRQHHVCGDGGGRQGTQAAMTATLLAFLLKLPLALLVFLLIAYAGTVSRRIAGVLLTFPILNGIAIIASPQPVVVADAIYPLVIFNCVLFALVITFPDALPPVRALPRTLRLFARVTAWSIVWVAGAYLLTDFRAAIPGAGTLLAGSAVFAILFCACLLDDSRSCRSRTGERGASIPGAAR